MPYSQYTSADVLNTSYVEVSYPETPTPTPTPTSYWDTGLPVVVIDTHGGTIEGPSENWLEGVSIKIYQNQSTVLFESDTLSIRGRGNSSWSYDKKPYALKLSDKAEILGMAESKRWCLLANYEDRTLMRNDIAFAIAKCTDLSTGMKYSPSGKFVEVVLNGIHKGNYYLSEQIRQEKNRVNIDKNNDYLLEYDRYYESEEFKFKTDYKLFPITIKSPDEPNVTAIKGKIDALETALYINNDFSNINFNSFADYWIVEELTGNVETADKKPGSVYLQYITGINGQSDEVIMGPIWDFDYSTFLPSAPVFAGKDTNELRYNYGSIPVDQDYQDCVVPANGTMTHTFINKNSIYYDKLFENPQFKSVVKQRWNAWYSSLVNLENRFDTVRD